MTEAIILTYLEDIRRISRGPYTEHTFRPSFDTLIRSLGNLTSHPVANVILEPGNITDVGAPDIRVYGPTSTDLVGYAETKTLGKSLDNLNGHDLVQFNRFRVALPTWIFTNFLEFRLFEDGRVTKIVTLCNKREIEGTANLRLIAKKKAGELVAFFEHFLQLSTTDIDNSRKLAKLLAHKALMLRDASHALLTGAQPNAMLLAQLHVYQEWLIPDLTKEAFADLLAQTITYGLFFAAYKNNGLAQPYTFTRSNLTSLIPNNIKPLSALFQLAATNLMPAELLWFVDDIMYLLDHTNMQAITAQFAQGTTDPTIHFYETFLSEYNPSLRRKRGIYYTPDAVVSYIVHSIDKLLRQHFNKVDGLASPDITLLDPALGTGTFIAYALQAIAESFGQAHAGDLPGHLRDNTLKHFYGFELLAAPYVLAHLKLGYTLAELGLPNGTPQIFLTNTLSDHQPPSRLPGPFELAISEDSIAAQRVKGQEKVLVILGNPPYAGQSANDSWERRDGKQQLNFIGRLQQSYYQVDGQPLRERNPKWLQNGCHTEFCVTVQSRNARKLCLDWL